MAHAAPPQRAVRPTGRAAIRIVGVVAAALVVASTTALVFPLRTVAPVVSLGVVYLVAVPVISTVWGAWLGVLTALASALARAERQGARELESLRRLAAVLGCHLLIDDVAEVAARVARERGTTYVLIGVPRGRRGLRRFGEPLHDRLLRLLPGVDLRIVADRGGDEPGR